MKTVLVLNGPNLNLLGQREPGVYGAQTLDDVRQLCDAACEAHGLRLDFRQSNHEGALIDAIHEAGAAQAAGTLAGVVLNAGAYTHTSVALHDAIKGAQVRVVELHISNTHAREAFRHQSHISPVAAGVLLGFGVRGYAMAIAGLAEMIAPA
ncbi:type II 3-dehydroquinate dehydratase [Pseudoduganella namucuonensis]|nr:type II 3-dehydroquinate dehydratase [Pseudoduganella namucuonensis]